MQELPNTVFLSKDLRNSQNTRSRFLLITHTHFFLSFDRYGKGQIAADAGVKVFDLLRGSTVFELRRRPVVPRAHFIPTLFMPTKRTEYGGIVAVRGIMLPQSGIAIDETSLRRFPLK